MQLKVTNSPFTEEQAELLNRLLPTLTETQLQWVNGFLTFYSAGTPQLKATNSPFTVEQADSLNSLLAALTEAQTKWLIGFLTFYGAGAETHLAAAVETAPAVAPASTQASAATEVPAAAEAPAAVTAIPAAPREATVLFGSQTGNSQRLAGRLANKLKDQGFEVTLSAMNAYKTNGLKKTAHLFIVASTHGEGDPPDNALTFHEFLHGKRAPKLDGVKFSILALGDTSYEFFCKTGRDFDDKLAELGAERIVERVECDVDFEDAAAGWLDQVMAAVNASVTGAAAPESEAAAATATTAAETTESVYSRSNPFGAELLTSINLNGRGSDRETRHLELSLEGSGLSYEPGDCVGIYPENDPTLVKSVIEAGSWNPLEPIPVGKDGKKVPLKEALLRHLEITVLTRPMLEKAAAFTDNAKLVDLVKPENKEELKSYIYGRDLLDMLRDFKPWKVTSDKLVSILRKVPPRLYSIASSGKAHPDEVHLTIRKVEYDAHGRERGGVCSVQVSERLAEGGTLPIFIQQNPNFKLPANPETPIVMIGPGTGVAPFRAFLEEKEEQGTEGKTWLFYGDRHFVTDFLYQTDWQRMLKDGVLTKLDVAFSRDTEEKVYVQHRMLESAAELYAWLQEGAHIYVCGDEKHMAHDVHKALLTILEQQGGLSAEAAAAYVAELQANQRYQRDVY